MTEATEQKPIEKRAYKAPELIVYGSVRNMTGGSCGFNFDGFFGSPNNGNPFGFGC